MDDAEWVRLCHKIYIDDLETKMKETMEVNEAIKKQRGKMSEIISRYKAKYGELDE